MNLGELLYFLTTYLSVDESADLVRALRTFSVKEPEAFGGLRAELRMLLSATTDLEQVKETFLRQGLFLLPQEHARIHQSLLEMHAYTEMVANADSPSKPYDVFISYASQDRPIASRLATDLSDRGYIVWLDAWELLAGRSIADEVYKGIASSQFVAVLLSQASCQSEWVQEELTASLMSEIETREVVILPLKIGECDIPFPLRDRRLADFSGSWENGLRELSSAMDFHRIQRQLNEHQAGSSPRETTELASERISKTRTELLAAMEGSGFVEGSPFKDVLIGPIDGSELDIGVEKLRPIVDASRVWVNRWGGPPFPYDQFPSTQVIELHNGLRYVDTRPWPYRSQSYHFWQVDSRFHFLQRSYIDEDFCVNETGDHYLAAKLVKSWSLIDIVSPLLFARSLLIHEPGVRSMGVHLIWGGLQNRSLLELVPNRLGFLQAYEARGPEWDFEIEVHRDSDIVTEARRIALSLFFHFGWQPFGDAVTAIDSDLRSLANRTYPE